MREQVDNWTLRINEMEETMVLTHQKLMDELGEMGATLDPLQEEIQSLSRNDLSSSFDTSHSLVVTHEQSSFDIDGFEKHTNDIGST